MHIVSVPSFGDSFFIAVNHFTLTSVDGQFPSPHSGILFLFNGGGYDQPQLDYGFRPLIRGFFFYVTLSVTLTDRKAAVSVPSFGDSFFIAVNNFTITSEDGHCFRPLIRGFFFYYICKFFIPSRYLEVVSVPSFGDSFFILMPWQTIRTKRRCFRPLIRGFFFYCGDGECSLKCNGVSVPSFGDSFFMHSFIKRIECPVSLVSVPSFGDSFFIRQCGMYRYHHWRVSVPSFGDSFFINQSLMTRWCGHERVVSVPSFGDSFFILSL